MFTHNFMVRTIRSKWQRETTSDACPVSEWYSCLPTFLAHDEEEKTNASKRLYKSKSCNPNMSKSSRSL